MCGWQSGKPHIDKVVVIWEENHDYASIIGSPSAPELNMLATECGLATDYQALGHPSLPNYLEMTSALSYSSFPWTSDCDPSIDCQTSAPSVFSELVAHGLGWRSYAEGMEGNCGLASFDSYAARHNPAVYYTSIRQQCARWDLPLGSLSNGALHQALTSGPTTALSTVTPDVDHDMHDGTVAQGDDWLSKWMPQMVASPAYRAGDMAILIAWDEGGGSGDTPSHAPLIVISPSTPKGTRSALPYNDFSILRAICELAGIPLVGQSGTAPSLVGPFRL